MKKRSLLSILLVAAMLFLIVPAVAAEGPAPADEAPTHPAPGTQAIYPGNYCRECHGPEDERLEQATRWTGTIERETLDPCPAMKVIHEEQFYTERVLLAIDRARAQLPAGVDTEKLDGRIAAATESYQRLLDEPVHSLEAFRSQAQMLRYRLGKSYTEINELYEAVKRQRVMLAAAGVTLVALISLAWGYWNIRKLAVAPGGLAAVVFSPGAIAALAGVFVLFSLPIFRIPSFDPAVATLEEQEIQEVLDTAGRAADAASQAQARIWSLSRVGFALPEAQDGEGALNEAVLAAQEAHRDTSAVWGERQATVELSAGSETDLEKSLVIASELNAAHSRGWGLRLAAAEWIPLDPARAETLLNDALAYARQAQGLYRDLDLRGIAVTWAEFDPQAARTVLSEIEDPAIRSWGWREVAALTGDASLYAQAAEDARRAASPAEQARLLREIGLLSGESAYFEEAARLLESAQGLSALEHAYVLGDLAAAWGRTAGLECDAPSMAPACATAFLITGEYQAAWEAALQIADPYERARAQAEIAAAWEQPDRAREIQIPTLRERALRDIAIATGNRDLAAALESPYLRVQALTALGEYDLAWQSSEALGETYPLVALGVALAGTDPDTALQAVEQMDLEADKAVVLRALALESNDPDLFARALGMALAARVRGDALAPVEASLILGLEFQPVNPVWAAQAFDQALDTARRISIK